MKKFISLFTTLSIVFGVLGTFTVFADETTADLEISTLAQLEAFRDDVNNGNTYEGKTVKLTADIDMSEKYGADINGKENSWSPIGTKEQAFNGVFDGCGYTIDGLYINSKNMNSGLFGHTNNKSIIKNLIVDGCINVNTDTNKSQYAGAVVGHNQGIIECCINEASINAIEALNGGIISGGIAGFSNGIIRKCANIGTVSTKTYLVGGICGRNFGLVENCFNAGAVSGEYLVGGLCAQLMSSGRISKCFNIGSVSGNDCVGDMVGDDRIKVIDNVYYCMTYKPDETASDVGTAKTLEQFVSGEVAYLLGDEWGQNIGVDEYPVISGDKVYFVNDTYTNTAPDTEITDITEISTLAELEQFRDDVNGGNTYESKTVKLTADIDMSEKYGEGKESWVSIGTFSGTFDGGGHKITKLYINDTGRGPFGFVAGTVRDLGVEGYVYATFSTAECVGGITSELSGTVENCFFSGSVEGERHIGGIVGANTGTVKNCYNTGTITAWEHCGGGIVGTNGGSIIGCYNIGIITKSTSEYASPYYGSITGGAGLKETDCYYLEGTYDTGAYVEEGTGGEDTTTVLTTEQFADKTNFTNWDFETVWDMDTTLGRPVLQSNREEPPVHIHTLVHHAAVAATCTENGTGEYWKCEGDSGCNKLFSDENAKTEIAEIPVISAKGHTEVTDIAVEPTCETDGKTAGSHCSVCNTVITAQTTISKLNHTWGAWSITTEPTFNTTGKAERICETDNTHKETVDVPVLSDREVWEESLRTEPTEIFDGFCTYISQYGVVSVTIHALTDKHFLIEYADGTAMVQSRDTGTYAIIFAAYDVNGVLTSIELKPVTFKTAGLQEVESKNFTESDAKTVKVMLWDSLTGMKPLCSANGN